MLCLTRVKGQRRSGRGEGGGEGQSPVTQERGARQAAIARGHAAKGEGPPVRYAATPKGARTGSRPRKGLRHLDHVGDVGLYSVSPPLNLMEEETREKIGGGN